MSSPARQNDDVDDDNNDAEHGVLEEMEPDGIGNDENLGAMEEVPTEGEDDADVAVVEADPMAALNTRDLQTIFRLWGATHTQAGFDPVPFLTRLSELIEEETDVYMRKDPDPFDERHPSRTDPECELGRMLKLLFRKDNFMTRLVGDYLRDNFFTRQNVQRSSLALNIAACRLILVIMPGLETSAVFQAEFDNLIHRLYNWAEHSEEPLCSYATGLLAAAMEVQDIAVGFREQNTRIITVMLKRLHTMQGQAKRARAEAAATGAGAAAAASAAQDDEDVEMLSPEQPSTSRPQQQHNGANAADNETIDLTGDAVEVRPFAHLGGGSAPSSPELRSPVNGGGGAAATNRPGSQLAKFRNTINLNALFTMPSAASLLHSSDTNQSTATNDGQSKYIRNTIPIHPATIDTSQMLILRYLTSVGEYQEFLGNVFEQNAMQLIYGYIENLEQRDTCLAFEALKYLASLLCHKKCALEFITHGGLQRLMRVPRPSIASTGVSIAMYYLAYCEDAMERICLMPHRSVSEVVTYAMWLLGSSHDSGRCHATMFFGLAFQFKVILDEFDRQDGLRKLFNVISVLPILGTEDHTLNDDEECAARQLVRHVCVALKKYMESHLYHKYAQITRLNMPQSELPPTPFIFRTPKCTPEVICEQVRALQELLPYRARWEVVERIMFLNMVHLLLRIIAYSYEWNYSGRAETVRSALDVLLICCVIPRVHMVFCERLEMPDQATMTGINVILGSAEGEIVADAECQKAALAVLVHIVCAPISKPMSLGRYGSARKKSSTKHSEELINRCWESVRNNNGIIVLLQLMETKTPITDADCIRGMACRAIAGLARSETVRQIISKLPLFTNGQLQALLRDPILQEKRTEHVQFQKYALELLERVSGKSHANNQLDGSLANIHKANVVAHTKIQFNEQQLHELIHEHLLARGLHETADTLQREAGLVRKAVAVPAKPLVQHLHSPFASFRSPFAGMTSRSRMRHKLTSDFNATLNAIAPPPPVGTPTTTTAPAAAATAAGTPSSSRASTTPSPIDTQAASDEGGAGGAELAAMIVDEPVASTSAACTPIKLIKKVVPQTLPGTTAQQQQMARLLQQQHHHQQRSLQKQISAIDSPFPPTVVGVAPHPSASGHTSHKPTNISLETIVTEYLTNQHALCKHPMSTCPQFDLFVPHKCPDPRPNKVAGHSVNFATRYFRRQGGIQSRRLDRRLVHSNFCVARTLRAPPESDCFFTACDFTPCASSLVVGSYSGEVRVFNINECSEEYSFNCHDSYINNVQCNRDGNLVLTSSTWRAPLSALWNIENKQFTMKWQWDEEEYMEFSNVSQDRVLGTKSELATIYDLRCGKKIASYEPEIYNQYSRNRATFCPTDELILSDGVLWDVRVKTALHKFDKLNQTLSGVFHPNGLEVVSNTEVWDLRTFHLLRTVPALDQCRVTFSPQNVMYGITPELDSQLDLDGGRSFDSSFKALDAYDFSSIATVDVKRNIYDLAVNKYGSQIAIVENQGGYESIQESVVRVYGVGRKKNVEDEAEDDENDLMSEDESGSDEETNLFGLRGADRETRRRRLRNAFMVDSDEGEWMPVNSSSSSSMDSSDASTIEFDGMMDDDNDDEDPDDGPENADGANDNENDDDDDDDDVVVIEDDAAGAAGGARRAASGAAAGSNGPLMPEFLARAIRTARGAAQLVRQRQSMRNRRNPRPLNPDGTEADPTEAELDGEAREWRDIDRLIGPPSRRGRMERLAVANAAANAAAGAAANAAAGAAANASDASADGRWVADSEVSIPTGAEAGAAASAGASSSSPNRAADAADDDNQQWVTDSDDSAGDT